MSLAWNLNPEVTLLTSAIWTRWSRFKTLEINGKAGQPPKASDIVSVSNGAPQRNVLASVPQNWADVWTLSFGGLWHYNDSLVLRAGYSHDNSPTRNTTRSARIPDNDRQWLTIGAGYQFNETYSVDLAYGYMHMKKFDIFDSNHKVNGERQGSDADTQYFEDPGSLKARYRNMHAHALAAQLLVRF